MSFEVSEGAAWVVLFSVLSIFTIVAFIASGWFGTSPLLEKLGCIMLPKAPGNTTNSDDRRSQLARSESVKQMATADFFLAARNSASAKSIALSFFASGMGAWVVYGSTEMGANPALSWLGALGYAAASSFPALIIGLIGPRVRKISGDRSFATTDFGKQRYGRLMQLSIACISIFYSEYNIVLFGLLMCILCTSNALFIDISVHLSCIRDDINLKRLRLNGWG